MANKIYKAILCTCAAVTVILIAVMLFVPEKEMNYYDVSELNKTSQVELSENEASISKEEAKKIASMEIPEPWMESKEENMKSIEYSKEDLKTLLKTEITKFIPADIKEIDIDENIAVKGVIEKSFISTLLSNSGKSNMALDFMLKMAPSQFDIDAEISLSAENNDIYLKIEKINILGVSLPKDIAPGEIAIGSVVKSMIAENENTDADAVRICSVSTKDGKVVIDYTK